MSTYYDVRVWWPKGQDYGGGHGKMTKEQADKEVERMKRMGYGRPDNPIHVRLITEPQLIRVVDKEEPRP